MQLFGGKPPLGVLFDSDMGNSIDDALALAVLYALDGKNEARVISVSVSKANLKAAALSEVIGRFYAGAVSGAFAAVGRTLPVGLSERGKMPEDTPIFRILDKKNEKGELVYQHGINRMIDTAEAAPLLRNALTSQQDANAAIVMVGPATNLAELMELPGAKDWIARKVKYLSMMGGAYPLSTEPEFNIKADIKAAQKLFAEWPTPIVASGFEVGNALHYPATSIENDFGWNENHPVADAYRAYEKMPYDAPAWDVTSVLYAVRPEAGLFKLSEPGTIVVSEDGNTKFTLDAAGRHRYLIFDPAQKERIVKVFVELATSKPVPRVPRFRQQQQQQQKQAPAPKPPVAPEPPKQN
jgi:inosine-uridine nucleoside N-ribohydrolase